MTMDRWSSWASHPRLHRYAMSDTRDLKPARARCGSNPAHRGWNRRDEPGESGSVRHGVCGAWPAGRKRRKEYRRTCARKSILLARNLQDGVHPGGRPEVAANWIIHLDQRVLPTNLACYAMPCICSCGESAILSIGSPKSSGSRTAQAASSRRWTDRARILRTLEAF